MCFRKNYKKTIGFVLFLSFSILKTSLFSQTLQWSPPEKKDREYPYVKVIGRDEEGYFSLFSNFSFDTADDRIGLKNRKYKIAYYNNQLSRKWVKLLLVKDKNSRIEKIVFLNERVLILSSNVETEQRKIILYAQELNNIGTYGNEITLFDIAYNKRESLMISAIISRDQSKIACIRNPAEKGDVNGQNLQVTVIDNNFSVLWKKNFYLPKSKTNLHLSQYVLSNEGILYAISKEYHTDNNTGKAALNKKWTYMLLTFNASTDSFSEVELKVEDKFLNDATISIDEQGKKILVAGFYSNQFSYSTAGTFYTSYNIVSGQLGDTKLQAFSEQILEKFIGEHKNLGKELLHYSIDCLIPRSDGGGVIVAEAKFLSENSYYDIFTQSFIKRTYYHYNNIFVISISSKGNIDWAELVNKSQITLDDKGLFSSYCLLIYLDKLYYIFNKSIERKNSVWVNTINHKGEKNEIPLLKESDMAMIIPKGAKQLEDNSIIIPSHRNKKFYFLKLSF